MRLCKSCQAQLNKSQKWFCSVACIGTAHRAKAILNRSTIPVPAAPVDSIFVPLTQGRYTLIDQNDMVMIQPYAWKYDFGYARTYIDKRWILLHRFLTGVQPCQTVDHINGDPLDNRRANLRLVTQAVNLQNTKSRGAVNFKGVYSTHAGWAATIRLGTFKTPEAAGMAYDSAVRLIHKDAVRFNFPRPGEQSARS